MLAIVLALELGPAVNLVFACVLWIKITAGNVNGSAFRLSNGWLPLGFSCLVVVIVAPTSRLVLEGFPVIWQIREMTPLRQLPLISLSVIGPSLIRP